MLEAKENDQVITVKAFPMTTTVGGTVTVTAVTENIHGRFEAVWTVQGPVSLGFPGGASLGTATIESGKVELPEEDGPGQLTATLDTTNLAIGGWVVDLTLNEVDGRRAERITGRSEPIDVRPRPIQAGDSIGVTLNRAAIPPTPDQALWASIRSSTQALSFDNYSRFIDLVMCGGWGNDGNKLDHRTKHEVRKAKRRTSVPFPNVERYRLLRAATEVFLMVNCGVDLDFTENGNSRYGFDDLEAQLREYLVSVPTGDGRSIETLPYLALVRAKLGDVPIVGLDRRKEEEAAQICYGIIAEKLSNPCFVELIHPYWLDEAHLEHTINAICWRFQNRSVPGRRDPLVHVAIDPIRPLGNYIWARIADATNRTTLSRRAFEYRNEYDLDLAARSGPPVRGADSPPHFIESFHHLLKICSDFYVADDDMTRIADGFSVLNALKDTHLHLSHGAHNQYMELPWVARLEMFVDRWILSRPEFSTFLPSRVMTALPEPWMDRVEAMKKLQGWQDTSVLHFRDLATFGEQILLGIRFGAWTTTVDQAQAANWAREWRSEIRQYIHAYRAVTGVDLTTRADGRQPAFFLRQRAHANRR